MDEVAEEQLERHLEVAVSTAGDILFGRSHLYLLRGYPSQSRAQYQ
jgi:hypothetical protein